jgi:hypothetical protein
VSSGDREDIIKYHLLLLAAIMKREQQSLSVTESSSLKEYLFLRVAFVKEMCFSHSLPDGIQKGWCMYLTILRNFIDKS